MKSNVVAWAAIVISSAALIGSHQFSRPVPAAQDIPEEGQKAAKALSEAFEAVADFAKPSVVQISVQKKRGEVGDLFGDQGNRRNPFRFFGDPGQLDQKQLDQLKEQLKRMHPELKGGDLDEMFKRFSPEGRKDQDDKRPDREPKAPFEREQFAQEGTGSGFVYDKKGHILTNNHVVDGAEEILVTFYDGETAKAKVVGADPGADVAVIKVDTDAYRPLPLGDSEKLRVGEWVIAVGSPFGLSQTVTAGIISATERVAGINEYESFVQTDAAINPGNSGGPLIDMNGRVIGINSAIATASRANSGVGFAIPIAMADGLAQKLIKDGKISRVRIGVRMEPLTPSEARKLKADPETRGVIIGDVVEDSPAAKAGLKKGDIITEFQGHEIDNPAEFKIVVSTSDADKPYELKYIREGKEQSTKITPSPEKDVRFAFERGDEERPAAPKRGERSAPAPGESKGFGLGIQTLTPELAKQFGYPEGTEGVVIASVEEKSPARAAGLEEGDLITKVVMNKKIEPVKDAKEFTELVKDDADELAIYVKDVRNPTKPGQFITLSKGEQKDLDKDKDDDQDK
ncbi:MAG: trypsin-like peptidase domain-containing protein [Isosphaeraceae bacterium]